MMLKRKRLLLYLIYSLQKRNKRVTKTLLDKLLFLIKKESDIQKLANFYNFYPYKFGPFSNAFYLDFSDLKIRGLIDKDYCLSSAGVKLAESIGSREKNIILQAAGRFADEKAVVDYVYDNYPEYTVKSERLEKKQSAAEPRIFSIGYEKKDADAFLDLLIQNQITVVADVRANPFSMNFTFCKNKLRKTLNKVDIDYINFPELGINGSHRRNLKTEADYARLFQFYQSEILPKQAQKIGELIKLGSEKRVALLCFEKDANHCHRSVLSNVITAKTGREVVHL